MPWWCLRPLRLDKDEVEDNADLSVLDSFVAYEDVLLANILVGDDELDDDDDSVDQAGPAVLQTVSGRRLVTSTVVRL